MRLWRISEWRTLDGDGGVHYSGRWHSAGQPIVYIAGSSALALLEVLVQQARTVIPEPYQLLEVDVPDDLAVSDWPSEQDHYDRSLTGAWGDAFLRSGETPLARVPSVIAPVSWNYLLNPVHAEARHVRIVTASRWPWDTRLFGREAVG